MNPLDKQSPQEGRDKRVFGNWYDNSRQEKAKEQRRLKRQKARRRAKRLKWFIVAAVMFAVGVFLLNNFDDFLGREHAVITYLGRGYPSGFFIIVNNREEQLWVHQLEWEALRIGQEIVVRETRQGPRIEDAPLSVLQILSSN